MIRACLSSDDSCTGIHPCSACRKAILTEVLPHAMLAAGFNGNVQIAQAFFDEFNSAHERLLDKVAALITAHMPAPPSEAPPAPEPERFAEPEPEPEPQEPTPDPDAPLTEAELMAMATVESTIEDAPDSALEPGPATFSSKAARAFARKARRLKQQRAGNAVPTETKEDAHGKEDSAE